MTSARPIRILTACLALLATVGRLQAGPPPEAATPAGRSSQTGLFTARQKILGARPLRLFYYYDDARGLESLQARASEITLLGLQCFWLDSEGFVHGNVPPQVQEIARQMQIPVMPLVINRAFDRTTITAMLRSPTAQQRAVAYLGYLANRDGYVGFQIDFENIDPADMDAFTAFVRRAATRLHRDRRLLSVAVVPRFSDSHPGADPTGEFRTGEWGAPYDYRALGGIADFIVLMAYDQHSRATPPGPVAGYAWVKAALEYAVQRVPRTKLLLGIPLYGRDWNQTTQGFSSVGLGFSEVSSLLTRPEVELRWHERWRAPWFQYHDGSGLRTVWFEDERSLKEKLDLIPECRLRGFAAWRLGFEDPRFWSLASSLRKVGMPHSSLPRARPGGASSVSGISAPARSHLRNPQE